MIGLAFDGEFEHPHPLPCQWMIDGDATGQGLRETSTFTKGKARDMMSTSHMFCHPTFRKKDFASFRRRTLPRWGGFLREAGSDGTQVTVPDTLRLRQQDCAKMRLTETGSPLTFLTQRTWRPLVGTGFPEVPAPWSNPLPTPLISDIPPRLNTNCPAWDTPDHFPSRDGCQRSGFRIRHGEPRWAGSTNTCQANRADESYKRRP